MSSILKALKKLENDNTSRKYGSFKVDAEILRDGVPHHFPLIGTSLIAALLFIGGAGATYFYLRPVIMAGPQAKPLPALTANLSGRSPAQETTVDAATQTEKRIDRTESAPIEKTGAQSRSQAKFVITAPLPFPKPHDNSLDRHANTVKTPETAHPNSIATKLAGTAGNQRELDPRPLLRVNGIAYQDKNEDSMAVVNGVTVSSGSVIAGAKVEGVLQDRVQFSFNGEKFDVFLGKSNQ